MPPKKPQKVLKMIPCHYWGRYSVKNSTLTLESAHQLLVSLQAKKSDHSVQAKFNIYEFGFKLVKKGPFKRSQRISFDSILRFFVFKSEPHLIFLGVEKRKRLSYLVVLFKEIHQVNEICDLIESKKGGAVRVNTNTETKVVPHYENVVESKPNHEEVVVELVNHETQSDPVEDKIVYIQSCEKEIKTPIVPRNVEYHYDERHTDDMGTTRIDALLLRTNKDKSINIAQWKEDMQYLDYNPDLGTATISEVGPIYMYTAHFTPTEYNNFGSCESDDSDSWGGDSLSSSDHQGMITRRMDGKTVIMAHRGSHAGIVL